MFARSRLRFDLDKRLYDDFERDDDDTYAAALESGRVPGVGSTNGTVSR